MQPSSINSVTFVVHTCMRMWKSRRHLIFFSKLETKSCGSKQFYPLVVVGMKIWVTHSASISFLYQSSWKMPTTFRNLIEIPSMKVGQLVGERRIFSHMCAQFLIIRLGRRIEFTTVRTFVKEFTDFNRSNSKHVKNRYAAALVAHIFLYVDHFGSSISIWQVIFSFSDEKCIRSTIIWGQTGTFWTCK